MRQLKEQQPCARRPLERKHCAAVQVPSSKFQGGPWRLVHARRCLVWRFGQPRTGPRAPTARASIAVLQINTPTSAFLPPSPLLTAHSHTHANRSLPSLKPFGIQSLLSIQSIPSRGPIHQPPHHTPQLYRRHALHNHPRRLRGRGLRPDDRPAHLPDQRRPDPGTACHLCARSRLD